MRIIACILFVCVSITTALSQVTQHNFITTFEGKLNEKLPIIASLECKDNILTGKYRYKTQLESLELKGEFFQGDSIQLKEYNKTGGVTGIFKGIYTANKISGVWSNTTNTKHFPFYLSGSQTNYEEDLAATKQKLAGKYGRLTISNVSENKIHVIVEMGNENCEMGNIEGDFVLISGDSYKGKFLTYDDIATYVLKVKGNEITLSQTKGEEPVIGGAYCYLEGTYKK